MARVLLVEDNIDLANMVRSMLESDGHGVQICHDGLSGLDTVLGLPFDLVVLDWDLPGMAGIDILRRFRETGALTPVIMLTGKDTLDNKEQGLDSGADDYLTKPFSMVELAARVRSHLRRATASVQNNLHLGEIILDPVNGRATRAGRTHVLTPAEFRLLHFAALYPHVAWQKADLLKVVWADSESPLQSELPEHDSGEEKLKSAIRRLRKKLDVNGVLIFPQLYKDGENGAPSTLSLPGAEPSRESDPGNPDLYLGTIVDGKYEILEFIGGGGNGAVYKARHATLDVLAALKVLHRAALTELDTVQRFEREARLAASLSHPNIIVVRDYGQTELGQPYLVMDLVEGASLAEILDTQKSAGVAEVLTIFRQLADVLVYLEQHGLVHRDIKPSNMMLTMGNGGIALKVIDLGLARPTAVDTAPSKITQTGFVLGSAYYMSPEQCRGETVDGRADIYSFGCCLYEALEGKPAFDGNDPIEILHKHVMDDPPALNVDCGDALLSLRLSQIVARCLAKRREDRYQSATHLQHDLSLCEQKDILLAVEPASPPVARPGESWASIKRGAVKWLSRALGQK